jgi:hypothetical protein
VPHRTDTLSYFGYCPLYDRKGRLMRHIRTAIAGIFPATAPAGGGAIAQARGEGFRIRIDTEGYRVNDRGSRY